VQAQGAGADCRTYRLRGTFHTGKAVTVQPGLPAVSRLAWRRRSPDPGDPDDYRFKLASVNIQTLIVESLRAEERAQRRHAEEREARAYLFHRDIHMSIADALGNLAASIEEGTASERETGSV
jgi:hypothetical protein